MYASNVSIILAIALVVVLIGAFHLDRVFASGLTESQRQAYGCLQRRRWLHLFIGIVLGSIAMRFYRPYTMYKMAV